jgi:hypothetical protein
MRLEHVDGVSMTEFGKMFPDQSCWLQTLRPSRAGHSAAALVLGKKQPGGATVAKGCKPLVARCAL